MRSKIAKKILSDTPAEIRIFVRQYTDIVLRIHELMQLNGFTQKVLADRMNKKPSEINKWLKGIHNLTLKTIAKLEAELGGSIIYTASSKGRKQSAR
jgi:transcriptional regulator with XRE-family HTH domain